MKLPPLEYASPESIDEAIALLAGHDGEAKVISGGQSLMPMLAFRLATPRLLVDLRHVPGLSEITIDNEGVELGGKVRWRDIEKHPKVAAAHPLLAAAVRHIGHYQIRNRGTVGGSLAHADPAAELPAIAVTCDATVLARGTQGAREIPASEFFQAPLVTALEPHEIVVGLRLPAWPSRRRFGFEEFARRRGDFALAGAAAFFELEEGRMVNAHIGALGVGDMPTRLPAAEDALNGRAPGSDAFELAAEIAAAAIEPRADIHADGDYRRSLFRTLLRRALQGAMERNMS